MVESVDLWLENHLAFGDDSFGLFDAVSDDNNATRMPNAKQFDDIFNMPIGQNKNGDEDLFPESLTFDEEGKELLEIPLDLESWGSSSGSSVNTTLAQLPRNIEEEQMKLLNQSSVAAAMSSTRAPRPEEFMEFRTPSLMPKEFMRAYPCMPPKMEEKVFQSTMAQQQPTYGFVKHEPVLQQQCDFGTQSKNFFAMQSALSAPQFSSPWTAPSVDRHVVDYQVYPSNRRSGRQVEEFLFPSQQGGNLDVGSKRGLLNSSPMKEDSSKRAKTVKEDSSPVKSVNKALDGSDNKDNNASSQQILLPVCKFLSKQTGAACRGKLNVVSHKRGHLACACSSRHQWVWCPLCCNCRDGETGDKNVRGCTIPTHWFERDAFDTGNRNHMNVHKSK
mmetsp:Transcript_37483/g.118202  ORF Transcript_37483/g.118202 Transcript_37483/m.118202 type:complete len:389 (+) Transcript_37483:246-1412(+)